MLGSLNGETRLMRPAWKTVVATQALRYYAYGKAVAVPSGAASLTATRTYVTGVRITVNPGTANDNPLDVLST